MVNELRTLLFNEKANPDGTEDYIDPTFSPVVLPKPLLDFHNLLFDKPASSRKYRLFLLDNFLNIIEASYYTAASLNPDSRKTYNLRNTNYFGFYRNSNITSSTSTAQLQVVGQYVSNMRKGYFEDTFQVRQLGTSLNIEVTSLKNQITPFVETLSFSGNQSQLIEIGTTGISFRVLSSNFAGSADAVFTFSVAAPLLFDFNVFYDKLEKNSGLIASMFQFDRDQHDVSFENQWRENTNRLYKFTGVILGFVSRVKRLYYV